jgi:predicted phosphate transport protein (TIGR00153 family)
VATTAAGSAQRQFTTERAVADLRQRKYVRPLQSAGRGEFERNRLERSPVIFGGKQRAVETLISRYLTCVDRCVDAFVSCIESSLAGESFDALVQRVDDTHQAESQADDVRQEIVVLLYGKALFPESRGDILGLLEAVDKIPNRAESVVRQMRHQRFNIPFELAQDFRALVGQVQSCSSGLTKAVAALFEDYNSAALLADRIGELESRSDDLEFELIDKIFISRHETAEKILLRDMVQAIGGIADRAENAADRVRIIAIKRKI